MDISKVDLQDMFGRSAGEDEPIDRLIASFVEPPGCDHFFSPNFPLCYVEARKGMGKSALLSVLRARLQENGGLRYADKDARAPIVISANKGDFIDDESTHEIADYGHASLESYWRKRICFRIVAELGKTIEFATSDDEIAIVESAEHHGTKERNKVSAVLRRFAGMLKVSAKAAGLNIPDEAGTPNSIPDAYLLLRRFQEISPRNIWLLVDDIDAKFNNTTNEQNLIGAFFSVIRELTVNQSKRISGLSIRATVRADVARSLAELEDEDKYRDYRIVIYWADDELRTFLFNRVRNYLYPKGSANNSESVLGEVFDSRGFKWSSKSISVSLAMIQLGGRRPRWISELCKRAGEIAKRKKGHNKIWFDDVIEAMANFGKDRVADITKEHKHQFTDIQKLVSAFRSGPPKYNRHALLKRIETHYEVIAGPSNVPQVLGTAYRPEVRHLLGNFLYVTEFIQGEISTGGFGDWKFYHSDPDLFDSPESLSNNIKWTINPVFRQFLQTKKDAH